MASVVLLKFCTVLYGMALVASQVTVTFNAAIYISTALDYTMLCYLQPSGQISGNLHANS